MVLRLLVLGLQWLLLALIAYNLITALWGWRNPVSDPLGTRERSLLVVIPAHDEETVVGRVVSDVLGSDFPRPLMSVWVVADRCRDRTAAAANAAGATVAERTAGEGGKGAALAWFLETHPLDEGVALVVLDADNRVPPDLLGRFSDALDTGAAAVQAYVDTTSPGDSWVTLASAMSYWAGNRMVQLSRHNLGWSPDLAGTGMCLTAEALHEAGGFSDSLVEDRDLSVRLALAGVEVHWLHDVRVSDEKPASAATVVRQRARWAAGNRAVARRHFGALLGRGVRMGRWRHIDQALRLVQPSRSFVAVISVALAVGAAVSGSDWLLPAVTWMTAALLQFFVPVPFLIRERVPLKWVVRYPVLAGLAVLWLPVQIVSRRVGGWVRTPHRGDA
jgi:cellulose synthase/poly-beta-1,6-N-acetylglucosamine synthase-like glycosyltransferase